MYMHLKKEAIWVPFKIVRNDITRMNTEAIVNTANEQTSVGAGCDSAVYKAAGYDELLKYREENVGFVPEGDVFITPGFKLKAKYIIHAVSPLYMGGDKGEEERLRSCYRKSLQLAKEKGIRSIAFPLISTGGFGYPKEEGMRIAVDEINAFLLRDEMEIFLVVFDKKAVQLGEKIYPGLETYIDQNYVREASFLGGEKQHESELSERMQHMSDTYAEYLMYLIQKKNMTNAEVWKRAIIDKKIFSKIKNNANYHPNKLTALCLCVGAKLSLNESKDLLARAGYAFSPCDKTDIIFSYFIENEIYDMIELDIQLEEQGLPCIIS